MAPDSLFFLDPARHKNSFRIPKRNAAKNPDLDLIYDLSSEWIQRIQIRFWIRVKKHKIPVEL